MAIFTVTSSVEGNDRKPTIGNFNLLLDNRESKVLTRGMFTASTSPAYKDPDGDPPLTVRIDTLSLSGTLLYANAPVTAGLVITIADIDLGLLTYIAPDVNNWTTGHFLFNVGNGQYADTQGRFGISNDMIDVEINLPPVVSPNSAILTENTYQFQLPDFIKDFADANGDSYEFVTIHTLPTLGSLYFNGVLVQAGFQFPLSEILNLEFVMPGNTIVSSTGYCEYDQDIDTIINSYQTQGYTLQLPIGKNLTFIKEVSSSLPNDTDIYAFFDTTSMSSSDAEFATTALTQWYQDFKNNNSLFTGELYIIPIFYERWVDLNDVIKKGTAYGKINNLGEVGNINLCKESSHILGPSYDWNNSIGIYPPNFDYTTNNSVNNNWTPPTKVLMLSFIDESNPSYHTIKVSDGFSNQPTQMYLEDYKRLIDNQTTTFEYFKSIFYPIPNIVTNNYDNQFNACVLQGFAAIEGGANYTLAEIKNLGVTFAAERKFHWYLDNNNSNYTGINPNVANPYSAEAHTSVPNTNYELQGLKNFDWVGIYDKGTPASAVFSLTTFANDLNRYLGTGQSNSIDIQVVEGDCVNGFDTCFEFATSDDSVDNLYSFPVEFCFNDAGSGGATVNSAPTVSSNSAPLRLVEHVFGNFSFIKDYLDIDGDPARTITIKSLPRLGHLIYKGNIINIGTQIPIGETLLLKYQLEDRYAIYNGIIYDFTSSIDIIIADYVAFGYKLITNINGVLTFESVNGEIKVYGTRINTQIPFDFTITDLAGLTSNLATFTLVPEGNINVKPTSISSSINQPPTVGNNTVDTQYDYILTLNRQMFVDDTDPKYSDPEGDQPFKLKVLSLPTNGVLLLRGVVVTIGQILDFVDDIDTGDFKFDPDDNLQYFYEVIFNFTISDTGSQKFA